MVLLVLSLHGALSYGTLQRRRNSAAQPVPLAAGVTPTPANATYGKMTRATKRLDGRLETRNSRGQGVLVRNVPFKVPPPPGKNELHPLLSLWILLFKVQDPAWEASHPFVRRGPGTRCHSDQPCLWEEVRKNRRKGALAEEVDTEGSKEKVGVRSTCRCPICPDPQAKEGKTFVGQLMGVISHNVWSLALPQCFPSGKREERPLAGKTVPLAELAAASCGSIAVRQR